MSLGMSGGETSSNPISPSQVSEYWKQAVRDVGMMPGNRSFFSNNIGSFSTTPTPTQTTGWNSGGGSSRSNMAQFGTSDGGAFGGFTSGLLGSGGGTPMQTGGAGRGVSGTPVSSNFSNSSGGIGTPVDGAGRGVSGTSLPEEGTNYDWSWLFNSSTPTSNMFGQDYPTYRESEYVQPSLDIADFIDYPSLSSGKSMLGDVYPEWKSIAPEGFDKLQDAIYSYETAGLDTAKGNDTTQFWGEAAKRGLGDDPAAMQLYGETVLTPYNDAVQKAGADATQQRYNLEAQDNQAYNTGMTDRTNWINEMLTYRTDAENSFNQWRTGESDTRANMENGYNLNSNSAYNSYMGNIWTTVLNNWIKMMQLWYGGYGTTSQGDNYGFNIGIPTKK